MANLRRFENLLLFGAIYYQLREFDMCIANNEEVVANLQSSRISQSASITWRMHGGRKAMLVGPSNFMSTQLSSDSPSLMPDAWANFANAYTRKGNLSKATECYRQALVLNPRLVDAYCNLGDVLRAQGLYRELLCGYSSIEPTSADAWYNIAGLLMQWGYFNKAVLYYKEAIKHKLTFYDAHLNLGNLYKAILAIPIMNKANWILLF